MKWRRNIRDWQRAWTRIKSQWSRLIFWRDRRKVAELYLEIGYYHLYARKYGVVIPDDTMSNILCAFNIFVKYGLRMDDEDAREDYDTAMRELDKHTRVSAVVLRNYLQKALDIILRE